MPLGETKQGACRHGAGSSFHAGCRAKTHVPEVKVSYVSFCWLIFRHGAETRWNHNYDISLVSCWEPGCVFSSCTAIGISIDPPLLHPGGPSHHTISTSGLLQKKHDFCALSATVFLCHNRMDPSCQYAKLQIGQSDIHEQVRGCFLDALQVLFG